MKCHARCGFLAIPSGYVDRAEWAEKMGRTHDQRQCSGCGLWTIWVQRRRKLHPDDPDLHREAS